MGHTDRDFFFTGVLHGLGDTVGLQRLPVGLALLRGNHCVEDAAIPKQLGEHPGIHPGDAHHVLGFQKGVHRFLTSEIRGGLAIFPDHHAAHLAMRALFVLVTDAVVAKLREGVDHQLPVVAGICQAFHAAGHARGEDQLAHGGAGGAEAVPFQNLTVFQIEICFFHRVPPSMYQESNGCFFGESIGEKRNFLTFKYTGKLIRRQCGTGCPGKKQCG